jgi:aspartyl/asparaginyl-tRNA synthetase
MVFLNLRQRTDSVQALLTVEPEKVSKQMVKWAAGLADESIVRVEGVVRKSPELIKSASVQDVEVHVTKVQFPTIGWPKSDHPCRHQLHLISGLEGRLPFSLDDASRPETDKDVSDVQFNSVLLDTRLNNRVVDLRVRPRF